MGALRSPVEIDLAVPFSIGPRWRPQSSGTPEKPFGLETKKTMRIKLKGYVLNTEER